jgi:N-acetylneuraminic acid mutarotase
MRHGKLGSMLRWLVVSLAALAACDGGTGGLDPDGGAPDVAPPPAGPGHWESLPAMPGMPRRYAGVAAVGSRLFVVGGIAGEAQEVAAFDTGTKKWETLDPLPIPIPMPNVAGVGGKLYVLGGADTRKIEVRDTFAYDPVMRMWTPRAPIPLEKGRGVAAVGVHGTKILLAGGILPGLSANMLTTGMRVKEFLAYDTATDSWEQLPDLALPRGYASGAVVGDVFWVIGGSTDFVRTDQVDAFDLKAGQWMDRPPPPQTLSSCPTAVFGGRIYVMGGIATGSGMIGSDTQVLEPSIGRWTTASAMTTPRFATGAATIGDRIYVPTGVAITMPPAGVAPVNTLEVFVP